MIRAALAILLAGPAAAGTPFESELKCPVGGETFTITETASCSGGYGRTMSLRQITSCDFVTRLPVCPGNGLPIYRQFKEDDIPKLEALVSGPDYPAMRDMSDWQRAYAVARYMGEAGQFGFGLQLEALWFDSEAFLKDKVAMSLFELESETELSKADLESTPYIKALVAYVRVASGRREEAAEAIAAVRPLVGDNEDVTRYLDRLEACNADFQPETCGPDAPFD